MNKLIAILVFLISFNLFAIEVIDKKIMTNIGAIHSLALDSHQSITIYLPENYNQSEEKFPVMYVIDGDKYFLNSIAYQKTLTWQSKAPAFIVVGINIERNKRRELLGEKSLEFIDTFQNKIIHYVDKTYRTSSKRMYFGWEKAGGFALDLLTKRPKLIDAYFLASSTHFTQERIDSVESLLKSKTTMPEFFYVMLGDVELWAVESHKELSKIFTKTSREDYEWEFNLSSSDDHYTTPLDTFNKGLARYFNDYAPIRFYSIKEFENFGGIKALREHYKKRGKHYQISGNVHSDTKHYLLNQSINENNFSYFTWLVSEFDGFIDEQNYSTGFIIKIGQFYSNNNAFKEAATLYESELIKNPSSQRVITELSKITDKLQ